MKQNASSREAVYRKRGLLFDVSTFIIHIYAISFRRGSIVNMKREGQG
jgi:hypothetical protein